MIIKRRVATLKFHDDPDILRVRAAQVYMEDLEWTNWDEEAATAEGMWVYFRNFGAPELRGPINVTAFRPVKSCGRPAYTRLTMRREQAGPDLSETLTDTIRLPSCSKKPALKRGQAKVIVARTLKINNVFWARAFRRSLSCSRTAVNGMRCKARWLTRVVAYGARVKLRGKATIVVRRSRDQFKARGRGETGLVISGNYSHSKARRFREIFSAG